MTFHRSLGLLREDSPVRRHMGYNPANGLETTTTTTTPDLEHLTTTLDYVVNTCLVAVTLVPVVYLALRCF